MRVLVTGATGFLGARCLPALRAAGLRPTGTGRNAQRAPAGFEFRVADLAIGAGQPGGVDALDASETADEPFEAVVHCAALSAPWGAREAFEQANVSATANLLAWARRAGVKRVVHISTPALYFDFRDQFDLPETAVSRRPINHYARTKAQAEALVQASGLQAVILRPRAIYGPGDTALLPRLEQAIAAGPLPLLRGGRAVTNLTHVDDVVHAIVKALQAPDDALPPPGQGGAVFNIAGDEAVSLRALVERIAARQSLDLRWRPLPLPLPLVMGAVGAMEAAHRLLALPGEPRLTRYAAGIFAYALTLNTDAAAERLDWRPQLSLEQGFETVFAAHSSAAAGPKEQPA